MTRPGWPTSSSTRYEGSEHDPYDAFYSWAARDNSGHGICGITDEPAQAERRLFEALDNLARNAWGHIRVVHLDRDSRHPSYTHGTMLRRVRRGDAVGDLVSGGRS